MKTSAYLAAAICAASFSFAATPTVAQTLDLSAACLQNPQTCAALVEAQIAALEAAGVSGAALDAAISQIASSVYVASQTVTDATVLEELADAITTAAESVSDSDAADGLTDAANTVLAGQSSDNEPEGFGLSSGGDTGGGDTGTPASPV